MMHRAEQSWLKELLNRHPQLIGYLLITLVFVFSLWLDDRNQESDDRKRCEAGVDSRNVDRDQTQRIYLLAMGSIPKDRSILSKEDRKRIPAYVKRVKEFREESFAAIKPAPICYPYVTDRNVTPEQWEKEYPPKNLSEKPGDSK